MDVVNGTVRLNVVEDGDPAAPPLLMLHGITSSVRTWEWLVGDLTDRFRVLRLDFRGHGRSDPAPGAYDAGGYISDAAAVCVAAGAPCVVVGHSLGGGTAAGLAQQRPDLVRAAVLEDPPLGDRRDLEGNALKDAFAVMRESVPRLQASGIPVDALAEVLGAAPSPSGPAFAELLHADALAAMAGGLLELDATVLDRVLAGTSTPFHDAAQPIEVPVLLVTADPSSPDAVTRPADAEQLAAVSPLAEVVVVAGAGHLVHDEVAHRDEFRSLVLGFLERVAPV